MNGRKKPIIVTSNNSSISKNNKSEVYSTKCDYLFKFKLLGDSGVGKSSLLLRYADNTYNNDGYISSIGLDFKIKTLNIDGKIVKTQVWDSAGQERFRTIESQNVRGAHAIIVVFDLTDSFSFKNVAQWLDDARLSVSESADIVLVGAKSDERNKRVIALNEVVEFISKSKHEIAAYIETSSKTDVNVLFTFETAARLIIDRLALSKHSQSSPKTDVKKNSPTSTKFTATHFKPAPLPEKITNNLVAVAVNKIGALIELEKNKLQKKDKHEEKDEHRVSVIKFLNKALVTLSKDGIEESHVADIVQAYGLHAKDIDPQNEQLIHALKKLEQEVAKQMKGFKK